MKNFAWILVLACVAQAQRFQAPGHPIGTIKTRGNLIVMTLDEGVLGKEHLFDLVGRTVRFTPDGAGYRIETGPIQWDSEFGAEMNGAQASLHHFSFPFSGKDWDAFSVGVTGSIAFGAAPEGGRGGRGGRGGGVSVERFAQLQEAGRTLINTVPAICVFFKPRMSGKRYLKELDDRAVVTWDLTEPYGGVQDFTWTPTVNRFQVVLRKNGTIEMSYNAVAAKDAIVGVYPLVAGHAEKEIATVRGSEHSGIAANLDLQRVRLAAIDGLFLKATLETRGPVLPEGDAGLNGVTYRVSFDGQAVWTIRGGGFGGRAGRGAPRYTAFGPGVSQHVTVSDNSISVEGTLPPNLRAGQAVAISADASGPGNAQPVAEIPAHTVELNGIRSPEVHLATVKEQDGPFPVAYEAFHYLTPPSARDLTCTVIKTLGDKFDFLAYYSDFRIDNPEAGTSSNGPLGSTGPAVTGIGAQQRGLESYCSQGRFQWQYIQPVDVDANQMQEYPPSGVTDTNTHDVLAYAHQLSQRTTNGKIPPYDYAMSQIGHEMGHRWAAFVSAKVGGETIPLGPTHWARGLQAPVPFPYQRPTEASAMGGGVWQDNYDGTFTQLDDDYYVPATGYSYLDLYLMGLLAPLEVPDFFILRNLVPAGTDRNGHPIFKADRTKVTIEDVIAAEGPRLPDIDHSQRQFNTGMVVVVEHGKTPSKALLERTEGIRERWIDYFAAVTGHRASMTANPR